MGEQEFTASLHGEYGKSCDVFGPDDFEACVTGSIVEIVGAVVRCLECRGSGQVRIPELQRLTSLASGAESEDCSMESPLTIQQEPSAEVCLQFLRAESRELEEAGFACAIDGVMGDQVRVTLSFPVPPEIARSTAEAWGFNRERLICVSLVVHRAHYSRSPRERLEGLTFWQEKTTQGFTKLDAGVQLCSIAKNFWPRLCGAPVLDPPPDGHAKAPEKQLAKKAAIIADAVQLPGVLLPLARYVTRRLPCLHEYCVICDEPLVFPPLLRPTVCTRTLCSYSARAYGAAVTGEFSGQNACLEVWDLLSAMAILTGEMPDARMRILFRDQDFPVLFAPNSTTPAFKADDDGFKKLRALLRRLAQYRAREVHIHGLSWLNQVCREGAADELLTPLLSWIWDSNRSYILSLTEEDRIDALATPYQYLLLSAPPEMEAAFQELKHKHGAEFCFHGSAASNWHSILRQGLKNASGTTLMTAGQAHGQGIYLARDSTTSAMYSGGSVRARVDRDWSPSDSAAQASEAQANERYHDPESLLMLAICEVAQVPKLKKVGTIWVCPEEAAVVTRFFLAYTTRCVPAVMLEDADLQRKLTSLVSRWTAP